MNVSDVAFRVSLGGIVFSADVSSSGNYSNEVLIKKECIPFSGVCPVSDRLS